ncbi:MAG: pyridoxine 5'-phosphate synthase [Elusimicrobia bacterium]|nr:pyridoxine 5'-phosphate synthase [Elusimicrobiota bacterium]
MVKLGVNVDHVATLREARREAEPDPIAAARACRAAGADLIVAHLRLDRRHMQEEDLLQLRRQIKIPLHLEICAASKSLRTALKIKPDSVCIVPERPGEVTTLGGLQLSSQHAQKVAGATRQLKRAGILVSHFIDPEAASVRKAKNLGADCVELCTLKYSEAKGEHRRKSELEKLELSAYLASELGLAVHAGHGLNYHNTAAVAHIASLEALNIGFSIVSRALFVGLKQAVYEMKLLILRATT